MKPLRCLSCLMVLLFSSTLYADITLRDGNCFIDGGQIYLSQNYHISLGQEPLNALKSGIVFYFNLDITLKEKDSWFATSHKLQRERILRYDHISRQFILEDPITLVQRGYSNVDAALDALGNINRMAIANIKLLADDAHPILSSHLQLNLDKLPVSLRLSTLFDRSWSLDSEPWICRPDA